MAATTEAISRFESEGVSWHRPPDYYAEMVKSDEQMARIKDRLMYEQQQIDQSAERCVRGLSTSCVFGRVTPCFHGSPCEKS